MQVEIWSDVVCPWCYIGKRRFERALESFGHRDDVEVVYRSFELDPDAPTGSATPTIQVLATKYRMSVQQAYDAQREMEQRAAADGLEFRMEELRSGNTRDAHRLLHLAKAHGVQAELAERLYRAYFTEEKSVFDHESLTDIAVSAGLDRGEVSRVLAGEEYLDAVTTDEAMAQELGASAVPLFVVDRRYGFSGAQPPEAIAQVLEQAWAEAGTPRPRGDAN
jgi:predicted DsbA family dithiol-disulfide isomerase